MKLSRRSLSFVAGLAAFSAVAGVSALAPTEAAAQEVRIVVSPPAPRVEVITVRPGPYHVWHPGVWVWHANGTYVWHPGHWVVPPPGKTVWVKDEWVSYAGSWYLVPGHFRAPGSPVPTASQRLLVTQAPPADVVETVVAAPAGQAWVHGHWAWDGAAYAWVPGHLMAVPVGSVTWEPGHWYASGPHWFYRTGYWR